MSDHSSLNERMTNYATQGSRDKLWTTSSRVIHESWHDCDDLLRIAHVAIGSVYDAATHTHKQFVPVDIGHIFRPLSMDREKINVVIVGQDPYPNANHACGYAFESEGYSCPASARVINENLVQYKHADKSKLDVCQYGAWRRQGVLMMNRYMTTIEGQSNQHALQWNGVGECIVAKIPSTSIVILLGEQAKALKTRIPTPCKIIEYIHPSPYNDTFGDRDLFGEANKLLVARRKQPINWTPGP